MTPEEALIILDEATSRLQLVRAEHITIAKALNVIKEKLDIK